MTLPRFAVLAPWGLALLAALATEGLMRHRLHRWPWRAVGLGALTAAVLSARPLTLAPADLALVALSLLLAATVILAPLTIRRWVGLAVAVELALLALGINPAAAPGDRLPTPSVLHELQRLVRAEGGRVVGIGGVLPPNLASRYGIVDLRDSDPLRPAPLAHLLGILGEPEPVLGGALHRAPARLCGTWSVRFLAAPAAVRPDGWEPSDSQGGVGLWRNPAWQPEVRLVGRSFDPPESAGWALLAQDPEWLTDTVVLPPGAAGAAATRMSLHVVKRRPDLLVAGTRCDGPCILVLAQPWAPGWRATIDGRRTPLVRANLAALGVSCSAGSHRVELRYRPW